MINRDAHKLDEAAVGVKVRLSALWAALMFLYVYADVLSLYKPGQLEDAMNGRMGPFPVSQGALLLASVLMIIPALMVPLALVLRPTIDRWANIVLGLAFTLVNIINLIGVTWLYYLLFGLLEIALTLLIVVSAWAWPRSRHEAQDDEATPAARRGMSSAADVPVLGGRSI